MKPLEKDVLRQSSSRQQSTLCVKLSATPIPMAEMDLRPCSLPHPNPKYFLFHPSNQIFRRMHGALNVGKKDN
jgi:hypothetical protein